MWYFFSLRAHATHVSNGKYISVQRAQNNQNQWGVVRSQDWNSRNGPANHTHSWFSLLGSPLSHNHIQLTKTTWRKTPTSKPPLHHYQWFQPEPILPKKHILDCSWLAEIGLQWGRPLLSETITLIPLTIFPEWTCLCHYEPVGRWRNSQKILKRV